jgi:GPI mannosyltransferase 3
MSTPLTHWRRLLGGDRAGAVEFWVVATLLSRMVVAVIDQGMFWPDEIFQSIEQAHRLAFGPGFIPWEFRDGARSWVFPGALAVVLKVASWLGARSGVSLVLVAKGFMVALGALATGCSMHMARRFSGQRAAVVAGALACTFPALIAFGARFMSEMAAGSLMALAVVLALDPSASRRRMSAAGIIAMTGFFVRFQVGAMIAALFMVLLLQRRFRHALVFTAGGALTFLIGGGIDWFTWGKPFHSIGVYLTFNVLEGKAANWGVSPPSYYALHTWTSTGWALVPIAIGCVLGLRRAWPLALIACAFVALHLAVPHKEYRFLMSAVPVALAWSAVGLGILFDAVYKHWPRFPLAWVSALALALAMTTKAGSLTVETLGKDVGNSNGQRSLWHYDEGISRAMWEASRRNDLCGFSMVGYIPLYSGGYSYLHRDVPVVVGTGPREVAAANYIAAPTRESPPVGYRTVATFLDINLWRREGTCMPVDRNMNL